MRLACDVPDVVFIWWIEDIYIKEFIWGVKFDDFGSISLTLQLFGQKIINVWAVKSNEIKIYIIYELECGQWKTQLITTSTMSATSTI